jgi:hypothetical protein
MIFIRTAFGGVGLGARAIKNLAGSIHGLIFLFVTFLAIYYLSIYVPKVIFAIRDYESAAYPYKIVSFFYHWFFNFVSLLITGPYRAGVWVFDINLTPYQNLNLILSFITGISLYIFTLIASIHLIKISKQSISKLIIYVLTPGILALIYFLCASLIHWTFYTDSQIEESVEATEIVNSSEPISPNLELRANEVPMNTSSPDTHHEPENNPSGKESINESASHEDIKGEPVISNDNQSHKEDFDQPENVKDTINCSPELRSLNRC